MVAREIAKKESRKKVPPKTIIVKVKNGNKLANLQLMLKLTLHLLLLLMMLFFLPLAHLMLLSHMTLELTLLKIQEIFRRRVLVICRRLLGLQEMIPFWKSQMITLVVNLSINSKIRNRPTMIACTLPKLINRKYPKKWKLRV